VCVGEGGACVVEVGGVSKGKDGPKRIFPVDKLDPGLRCPLQAVSGTVSRNLGLSPCKRTCIVLSTRESVKEKSPLFAGEIGAIDLFCLFETVSVFCSSGCPGTLCVAQVGLEFMILLPLPPKL
jgi:hypothetical protein